MNFLAHTFLAHTTETSLFGNYLGEFIKGPVDAHKIPKHIKIGVRLHRRIDSLTDNSPIFLQSKKRLPQKYHRFAGIILDIAYDHFLSVSWRHYSEMALDDLAGNLYEEIEKNFHLMPSKHRPLARSFVDHRWIERYATFDEFSLALEKMSRRVTKRLGCDNPIAESVEALNYQYEDLAVDFNRFFPELIKKVQYEVSEIDN